MGEVKRLLPTLDEFVSEKSGMKSRKVTAFQNSMIRQSVRNIKALNKKGFVCRFLMGVIPHYKHAVNENIRLSSILHEKERKLASSDAQVSELSKSIRYLTKIARERKLILRENNLL